MLKKLSVLIFVGLAVLVVLNKAAIAQAVYTITGFSAKLSCSQYFISGLPDTEINQDRYSYSLFLRLFSVKYDLEQQTAMASLFGYFSKTAHYHSSSGCNLGGTYISQALINSNNPDLPRTINRPLQQRLDEIIQRDKQQTLRTRALLIVDQGVITAEYYAPAINRATPLLGWSMAKGFTSLLFGRMVTMGLLQAEAPINHPNWHFKRHLPPQWQSISLANLLQMNSGIDFPESYIPGSRTTQMLFYNYRASELIYRADINHRPGSYYQYSSASTNLLTHIMDQRLRRSQQTLAEFADKELIQPLKLQHVVMESDPSGLFVGSSYLYATADDWARLGLLLLHRGRLPDNQQLLDDQYFDLALAPNPAENNQAFGYSFWLNTVNVDGDKRWPNLAVNSFGILGSRSQFVVIQPDINRIIVRLGWSEQRYPINETIAALNQIIPKAITNKSAL